MTIAMVAVGQQVNYPKSFVVDKLRYQVNSDDMTVAFCGFDGIEEGADVVVPQEVTYSIEGHNWTYTVTEVNSYFYENYGIEYESAIFGETWVNSIVLPPTVTRITDRALRKQNSGYLKSIDLGGNIEYIGDLAFYEQRALTKIENVGDKVSYIGRLAFYDCKSLEHIGLPATATHLGEKAFYSCEVLEDALSFPLIDSIGENTFFECWKLGGITLGEGLKSIGKYAFQYAGSRNDNGMPGISLPSTVRTIEDGAFLSSGFKRVDLNDGIESFGSLVFQRSGIEEINWPGSLKEIPSGTFSMCKKVQKVNLGEGLEVIGGSQCGSATPVTYPQSLKKMTGLFSCLTQEELVIPDGVESFLNNIYWDIKILTLGKSLVEFDPNNGLSYKALNSLTEIHCRMPEPVTLNLSSDWYVVEAYERACNECTLYVPKGTKALYTDPDNEAASFWRGFKNIVEENGDDEPLSGDINGDGGVNVGDVGALYSSLLSGNTDPKLDINKDGSVNTGDVSAVYQMILGQ